jgi:hypothetical protein
MGIEAAPIEVNDGPWIRVDERPAASDRGAV